MIAKNNVKVLTDQFRKREQLSLPVRLAAMPEGVTSFTPEAKELIERFFASGHITMNILRIPTKGGLPYDVEFYNRSASRTGERNLTEWLADEIMPHCEVGRRYS